MARHSMRESRSTLDRFVQTLLLDIHFRWRRIVHSVTVTSEMTKTNVVVVVFAPDQRPIHSNYACRYSHAPGGEHIGVGLIVIVATVGFLKP